MWQNKAELLDTVMALFFKELGYYMVDVAEDLPNQYPMIIRNKREDDNRL